MYAVPIIVTEKNDVIFNFVMSSAVHLYGQLVYDLHVVVLYSGVVVLISTGEFGPGGCAMRGPGYWSQFWLVFLCWPALWAFAQCLTLPSSR